MDNSALQQATTKSSALRRVEEREQRLQAAVQQYRFDVQHTLHATGIQFTYDVLQDRSTVLIVEPRTRTARFHPGVDPCHQRLALAMFLSHWAITCERCPLDQLKPYLVYRDDLINPEGPYDNGQWHDFMQALELVIPLEAYKAIGQAFPDIASYAIMRVLEVSFETLQFRSEQFMRTLTEGAALPIHLPTVH